MTETVQFFCTTANNGSLAIHVPQYMFRELGETLEKDDYIASYQLWLPEHLAETKAEIENWHKVEKINGENNRGD